MKKLKTALLSVRILSTATSAVIEPALALGGRGAEPPSRRLGQLSPGRSKSKLAPKKDRSYSHAHARCDAALFMSLGAVLRRRFRRRRS